MDRLTRYAPRTFACDDGTVQVSVTLDGTVKLSIRQLTGEVAAVEMSADRSREVCQGIRAKGQAAEKEAGSR
ncbi:hypothetical protein [Umezawaea sp. NPDC059074]|uniref:hypothetical protein n=1 Tax=Umezawaea sp. NPDC059074 TaxID=3346716 RepID=UPI0036B9C117